MKTHRTGQLQCTLTSVLAASTFLWTSNLPIQAELLVIRSAGTDENTDSDIDSWTNGWTDLGSSAGSVDFRDLALDGGALEAGQTGGPTSPSKGAVRLQTTSTIDIAELRNRGNFGLGSSGLQDIDLGYRWYKEDTGSLGEAAAPSLKIELWNPGPGGSFYSQLVYEPYNQALANPTTGSWQIEALNENTGLWWSTGGGFADSDLRTLSQWQTEFATNNGANWAGTSIIGFAVAVGSDNPNQLVYFDSVSLDVNGIDKTFEFAAVPEPSSALIISVLMGTLGIFRRRRRRVVK